jgi:transposase
MTISEEKRQLAIQYISNEYSIRSVARILQISTGSVRRIIRFYEATGGVQINFKRRRIEVELSEDIKRVLLQLVTAYPALYLDEYIYLVKLHFNVELSMATLSRLFKVCLSILIGVVASNMVHKQT